MTVFVNYVFNNWIPSRELLTRATLEFIFIVNKRISSEIATRYCGELILFLFSYYTLFASPNYSRTNTRLRAGGLCKADPSGAQMARLIRARSADIISWSFLCVIAEAGSRLSRKCERTCAARLESAIIQLHSFAELSGTWPETLASGDWTRREYRMVPFNDGGKSFLPKKYIKFRERL